MPGLKIDTQTIRSTAGTIAAQNERLFETLTASQSTVQSLSSVWTGAASEATISAYDSFAANYFENYREMLDQYVKFLNNVAGAGYEQTEQQVTSKASEI